VLVNQNKQWVALAPPLIAGNEPHGLALHPGKQLLFVANQKDNTVSIFDYSPLTNNPPSNPTLVATVALSANGSNPNPHGIGVDTNLNQVYVACRDTFRVAVIQLANGAWTNGNPISLGANQPVGVGVNSETGMVYVSVTNASALPDARNVVVVIDGNNLSNPPLTISSPTFDGPDRFAVDEANDIIYVSNNTDSSVSVIDAANYNAVSSVKLPGSPAPANSTPTEMGLIPAQEMLYVALQDANEVGIVPFSCCG
jgi:YVTN family beta-propeller protein